MKLRKFFFSLFVIFFLGACDGQEEKKYQPVSVVNHPLWSLNKVVYRINLNRFSSGHTFSSIKNKINEIKSDGIGIILISAIQPGDSIDNKFMIKDYLGINPKYGTQQELKEMIATVHGAGMYIIMDWYGFKSSPNNALIYEQPDYFHINVSAGSQVSNRFNYDNPEMQEYMLNALKYWVYDLGFDGYFCFDSENIPIQFWDKTRKELELIKPVFMAADGEASFLHNRAFDMTVSSAFFNTIQDVASGFSKINTLDQILEKDEREYAASAFRMRFTSFHDMGFKVKKDEIDKMIRKPAAVLTMTFPGKPLIDYTDNKTASLENIYRKISQLYIENPALHLGKMIKISEPLEPSVYAFARLKEQYKIIVLLNFSDKQEKITLDSEVLAGSYVELFSNVPLTFGESREFDLEPWAYRVFVADK